MMMWNQHTWLDRLKKAAHLWSSAMKESMTTPTVLIVDDEAAISRFVQRVLQDAGFTTLVAHDGAEAVTLAVLAGDINLVVTDLMMPHMNGDELARRLRANQPDLPVLYLTGFSDRLFADRMQLWENEAFLDKPCSVKGLLEAVALISHRRVPGTFGVGAAPRPSSIARPDAVTVA
jgi:DNA-binding response OmpR family regulator